jgi:hypothetical protein
MSSKIQRLMHHRALSRQFSKLLYIEQVKRPEWEQAIDVYLLNVPAEDREDTRAEVHAVFNSLYLSWPHFQMGLAILGLKTMLKEGEIALCPITIHNGRVVLL